MSLDPTATSLSGWTGQANLNKQSGNVTANFGVWGMSPGLEVNDLGFSTQTDRAGGHAMVLFRKLDSGRLDARAIGLDLQVVDLELRRRAAGRRLAGGQQHPVPQLLAIDADRHLRPARVGRQADARRARPSSVPAASARSCRWSPTTARSRCSATDVGYTARQYGASAFTGGTSLTLRPVPAVTVSAGPAIRRNIVAAQYLSTVNDPLATQTYGQRYVFGELDQTEVSMIARLSVVLSPRMSLQMFLQPLVSAGDYGAIKEVAAPRTFDFVRYGEDAGSTITAGPGRAGTGDRPGRRRRGVAVRDRAAGLQRPIAARQHRLPLGVPPGLGVLLRLDPAAPRRWTPRAPSTSPATAGRLFSAPADDVLLVKMSYWFGHATG